FLLYVRCLGVTQRNSQKMAIAPAHLTLLPLPSKPPSESVQEIKDSGLLRQLAAGAIVYTDGCASWKTAGKALPRKRLHFRKVVHNKSEWTKVTRVNLRARRAGTQQIDRCWHHLKKTMPSEMKSRGPSGLINSSDALTAVQVQHHQLDLGPACHLLKGLCREKPPDNAGGVNKEAS
ncbi:unnamed protein product, partial [Effrenium voratum]